jgi:uncharacterized membrane protein
LGGEIEKSKKKIKRIRVLQSGYLVLKDFIIRNIKSFRPFFNLEAGRKSDI